MSEGEDERNNILIKRAIAAGWDTYRIQRTRRIDLEMKFGEDSGVGGGTCTQGPPSVTSKQEETNPKPDILRTIPEYPTSMRSPFRINYGAYTPPSTRPPPQTRNTDSSNQLCSEILVLIEEIGTCNKTYESILDIIAKIPNCDNEEHSLMKKLLELEASKIETKKVAIYTKSKMLRSYIEQKTQVLSVAGSDLSEDSNYKHVQGKLQKMKSILEFCTPYINAGHNIR